MHDDPKEQVNEVLEHMRPLLTGGMYEPDEEVINSWVGEIKIWYETDDPENEEEFHRRGNPPEGVRNALYGLNSAGYLRLYNVIEEESQYSRDGGVVYMWPSSCSGAKELARHHHESTGKEVIVRERGGSRVLRRFKAAKRAEVAVVPEAVPEVIPETTPDTLDQRINEKY